MATKKQHTYVKAETDEKSTRPMKQAKEVGSATGKRVGAVILWIIAIAFEVVSILLLVGKISITFMPTLYAAIIALVLDLVFLIIGSQLWKKANHIDPASEKNAFKFWLWNNMGVIVACFAFVPFIVLLLTNKDLDKKTKTIASAVAVVALAIGGLSSYDYNPVSSEQKEAAMQALGETEVYWTQFGKVYHTHDDCGHLNQTEELICGTVEQAIANNRTRLCLTCAKQDNITDVTTE